MSLIPPAETMSFGASAKLIPIHTALEPGCDQYLDFGSGMIFKCQVKRRGHRGRCRVGGRGDAIQLTWDVSKFGGIKSRKS